MKAKNLLILAACASLFLAACSPEIEVEENQNTGDSEVEQSGNLNADTNDEYNYSEEDEEIDEITEEENNNQITDTTMKLSPEAGDTIATISTNKGDIKILLYTEKAPETTKNFIELANEGKYDGVIFHRIIEDFMIQTGDFENGNGTGGYSYQGPGTMIEDEFGEGLEHVKGAVSMANRGPNTGGSQFFIVQAEAGTPWLDGGHAIFGYAYEGMDVIDSIAGVEVDGSDRPFEDITIESVTISQQ